MMQDDSADPGVDAGKFGPGRALGLPSGPTAGRWYLRAGLLIDGQFVTASIRERKEEPRLVIPQSALQADQSGYYALVVNAQHEVEVRRVQTGPNLGTDVVVTSGVREGENVIVDGIQKVRPGQVVQETMLPPKVGG